MPTLYATDQTARSSELSWERWEGSWEEPPEGKGDRIQKAAATGQHLLASWSETCFHWMLWKWPRPANYTFRNWVTESDSELGRRLPPANLAKNNMIISNWLQNKMAAMKINNLCRDEYLVWIDDFLKQNEYISNSVFFLCWSFGCVICQCYNYLCKC